MTDDASSTQSLFGAGTDKQKTNAIDELVDLMTTSSPANPVMAYLSILSTSMNMGITSAASKAALNCLSTRWPGKSSDDVFKKEVKKETGMLEDAIRASVREAAMCALADEARVKKYVGVLLGAQARIVEVKLQGCYGLLPRPSAPAKVEEKKVVVGGGKKEDVEMEEAGDDADDESD
jgi:hypothetical protein